METIHPHCAGLDVHKDSVYACVRRLSRDGKLDQEVRSFGTATRALLELSDWLASEGVTHVAMESTGVYWIPLFQILEAHGFEVCLVNARHVKNVPSRKSDVADCQWLQYLHAVGLLRASFRPPAAVCAVRSLLRHRDTLVT